MKKRKCTLLSICYVVFFSLYTNLAQAVLVDVRLVNPNMYTSNNDIFNLDLLFTVRDDSNDIFDPDLVLAEYGSGGAIRLYNKYGDQKNIQWCGSGNYCLVSSGLQVLKFSLSGNSSYPETLIYQGETVQYTYHKFNLYVENLDIGDYAQVWNGLDFDYSGDTVDTYYPEGAIWKITTVPLPAAIYLFSLGIISIALVGRKKLK